MAHGCTVISSLSPIKYVEGTCRSFDVVVQRYSHTYLQHKYTKAVFKHCLCFTIGTYMAHHTQAQVCRSFNEALILLHDQHICSMSQVEESIEKLERRIIYIARLAYI